MRNVMFGILAAFVTMFLAAGMASAQSYQSDYFYSDRPGWTQSSYHLDGYESGGDYFFYGDYYLADEEVAYTQMSVSYTDGWDYYSDYEEYFDLVGDSDAVMLEAELFLPSNATGTIYVEFVINFADGTSVTEYGHFDLP